MKLLAADLFCGAGGTSTGLVEAALQSGHTMDLTAVNHWPVAVDTHSENHPAARHLCASLDSLNPRALFQEGELDILWASPECTHHSIARGGKPVNDQSRATAWCVVRWAEALRPAVILIENVKEFANWGPIGTNGKPLKRKKGDIFKSWIKALESIGYRVEWRVLCAADYGDPTTRRRLFIYAVRGSAPICWPDPSHHHAGESGLTPWIPAREIIDWTDKGRSVFTREKPLAEKTMRRILIGLEKYGLVAQPYLVKYYGSGIAKDVQSPLDTVTTKPRYGLCQPIVEINGETYMVDILFRMLKPAELAQAQGFPKDYRFKGNTTEVVKQIGNAVPKNLAKALGLSAIEFLYPNSRI